MSRRVCLLSGASGALGRSFIGACADRFEFAAVHFRHPVHAASDAQIPFDPLSPEKRLAEDSRALLIQADLTERGAADLVVAQVLERFGRIDLLVNAAAARQWAPLLAPGALDPAEDMFRLNVLAPLRLAVAAARQFWRGRMDENIAERRNVVHLSSSAGAFVYEDLGQGLYSASKAALDQLTYHMASEFWDIGVRINAIAPDTFPGRVATDRVIEAIIALDQSERTGEVVSILRPEDESAPAGA